MMRTEKSFNLQIWVGLRSGYGEYIHPIEKVREICNKFVNTLDDRGLGDCVSITPTEFRYIKGWEPRVIVEYINYPRFPRTEEQILKKTLALGEILRVQLFQERITVVTPETTYLLEDEQPKTH
jgi:hypothetical protein